MLPVEHNTPPQSEGENKKEKGQKIMSINENAGMREKIYHMSNCSDQGDFGQRWVRGSLN